MALRKSASPEAGSRFLAIFCVPAVGKAKSCLSEKMLLYGTLAARKLGSFGNMDWVCNRLDFENLEGKALEIMGIERKLRFSRERSRPLPAIIPDNL